MTCRYAKKQQLLPTKLPKITEFFGKRIASFQQKNTIATIKLRTAVKNNDLTVVAEYASVMEAEMTRSLLESEGIPSEIENEYMSSLYPTGAIPSKLMVRGSDLERARAVIDSHL